MTLLTDTPLGALRVPTSPPPMRTVCSLALLTALVAWLPLPMGNAQDALPSPLQAEPIAVPKAEAVASLPAVPGATVPGSGLAATAAGHPTVLQILGNARRGFCAHLRQSPIGKLTAELRKPLSIATGGMVPAEKAPHPDEKSQPGPEGTAAQLKTVQLQAPKRQQAIADLKYVDVRYHPEVEATLIAALRADPSECVRLEAAMTLATLPVCTPAISKALKVCMESKDSDGNPAELSDRVRMYASRAFSHCSQCAPIDLHDTLERPEYPHQAAIDSSYLLQASASLPITAALAGEATPTSLSAVAPDDIELSALTDSPLPMESVTATVRTAPAATVSSQRARPRPKNLLEVLQAAE